MSKHNKIVISLLVLSVAIIIIGILFLLNAMQENPEDGFFPAFCQMPNLLAKYIVVIVTMATGIMLFSNVALQFEDKKLRNGLTIGITAFSTILTVPLVYVFIAIFIYHAKGVMGPVGKLMALDRIEEGFIAWFKDGPFLWVIYSFMLVLSIIFITFPLLTGVLACHGKTIKVGAGISIGTLPIIEKQQKEEALNQPSEVETAKEEEAAEPVEEKAEESPAEDEKTEE